MYFSLYGIYIVLLHNFTALKFALLNIFQV